MQNQWPAVLALLAGAFACGSIPFGLVVGRAFFGSDIRAAGSGNIGAANALRAYGKAGGAAVLVLDALKGFVPAAFARAYFDAHLAAAWGLSQNPAASYDVAGAAALAAVLGHCYSPVLKFKGGKGVATLLGTLFALSWPAALAFVLIWLAVVLPSRYSSLGSLSATALSPWLVARFSGQRGAGIGVALAALVIFWKHRENIARLRAGRENRIGFSR